MMYSCHVPLGQLPTANGDFVLSLGGIFLREPFLISLDVIRHEGSDSACDPVEQKETQDAEEAHAAIFKMSNERSNIKILPCLHRFIHSRHANWFKPLWHASTTPDVLRKTCKSTTGSTVWKVLLLNAEDSDIAPLLFSCITDVPGWMENEHASKFLICALLHAHPVVSHALARSVCISLAGGTVDTSLACARHVIVALAQTGFPMIAHALRTSPIETVTPLLLTMESDKLLSALAQIAHSQELLEFLQLWHPALRRR